MFTVSADHFAGFAEEKDSVGRGNVELETLGSVLDKLGERKYLIQITDETPELRISLFDRLDQSLFRIEYFFKEINVGEDSCYYAYFIRKTRTSTTS